MIQVRRKVPLGASVTAFPRCMPFCATLKPFRYMHAVLIRMDGIEATLR